MRLLQLGFKHITEWYTDSVILAKTDPWKENSWDASVKFKDFIDSVKAAYPDDPDVTGERSEERTEDWAERWVEQTVRRQMEGTDEQKDRVETAIKRMRALDDMFQPAWNQIVEVVRGL